MNTPIRSATRAHEQPLWLRAPTLTERLALGLGRPIDRIREYGPADEVRDELVARVRLYGQGSPAKRGRVENKSAA